MSAKRITAILEEPFAQLQNNAIDIYKECSDVFN